MIIEDRFRSRVKKQELVLDTPLILQILEFIHPHLYYIISPKLISYCGGQKESLPVAILLSLSSIATLESFKTVLLGFKFNYHSFSLVVASWGDFETLHWFHSNGWGFHYEILPTIAERGDEVVFMKYLHFCKDKNFDGIEVSLKEALVVAAKLGRINILEAAFTTMEVDLTVYWKVLLEAAAIGGQVDVLQWIWNNLLSDTFKEWSIENGVMKQDEAHLIMISAILNGNIDTVRWLSSKNIKDDTCHSTINAARGGNLEVLKHVISLGCPWSKNVCIIAAENGNLELLKWAVQNGCPWNISKMFPAAASCKRPNLELFQWLLDQGCPFVEAECFKIAANIANFEFIQFAQSKGSTEYDQWLNKFMIHSAIRTGRVEALEWSLRQVDKKGLALDMNRTDEQFIDRRLKFCWIKWAAEHGHVNILEYLRVWFCDEFWVAPKHRFQNRPEKLYRLGIIDIVKRVAAEGHLNVLDWIAKYRPDWNTLRIRATVFEKAIDYKKLKVLIWLKSQSTGTSALTWFGDIEYMFKHPSDCAFSVGDFEIFQWVHKNGCPWNKRTDWLWNLTSARHKRHFIEFAAENGCPNAKKALKKSSFHIGAN